MKLLIIMFFALSSVLVGAQAIEKDQKTGLIKGENWRFVELHCTHCHSGAIISQNRMTRKSWSKSIQWMQKNHGLWPLGQNEPIILDYLEKYYAPKDMGRRKNLPAHLMP